MGSTADISRAIYSGQARETGALPQGYTYLAQMLSHELLPASDRECGRDEINGRLELTSLYGGVTSSPYLFRGRFEIDRLRPWDVPRNRQGDAKIAEPRNDGNILLAQMHALWCRLHNHLRRRYVGDGDEAANWTRMVFQLAVIDDLARRLLMPAVYEQLFEQHKCLLRTSTDQLAIWMAAGVFRFGHSMVRDVYSIRPGVKLGLDRVLRRDSAGLMIPSEQRVFWQCMFPQGDEPVAYAARIDTSLTPEMQRVRPSVAGRPMTDIVVKDLEASAATGSGGEIRMRIIEDMTDGSLQGLFGLDAVPDVGAGLDASLDAEQLPLWLYVLSEAEASDLEHSAGALGPLASVIVGEFLRRSCKEAMTSIYQGETFCRSDVLQNLGGYGDTLRQAGADKGLTMRQLIDAADLHIS